LGASQALFWILIESSLQPGDTAAHPEVEQQALSAPAIDDLRGQSPGPSATEPSSDMTRWKAASMTLVPVLAGGACWLVIYVLLPRPMWVYVFGHELTHVIWAWVFEARVKKFHVSSRGGHVILDKVNFLIVLAPYFFPLYALCVAGVYAFGNWVADWESYRVGFLLLLGAAYAFHVTLTVHALKTEQTDITSQGWFFSIVIIWLGNLLILVPGLCLLLGISIEGAFAEWGRATWSVLRMVTGRW
jgi:hypothetical protein